MALYIKLEKIEETINFIRYRTEGDLTTVFIVDKVTGAVSNLDGLEFNTRQMQAAHSKLHQFFLTSSYPEVDCWAS